MVGRLVWLKWRLLVNGVRADRQRAFGLPIVTIGVAAIGFWLANRFGISAGEMTDRAAGDFTLWVMLVVWLAWTTLPVLLFPLDETLDPARFALAPLSRTQLMAGLTAAGLVTPTIVVPVLLLATNVAIFSGPLTALVALIASGLLLLHFVVGGQTFTALVSLVLRSRRGRDLAVVIVSSLGLLGFALQQTIASAVGEYGLAGAVQAYSLSSWWWALPPVAAQQAAVAAAAGSWGLAILALAVSSGWLLVVIYLWNRLLLRLVTTPESSPLRSRKRVRSTLADRPGWSTPMVVARKELLFYVRDPRLRMVWTGAVIFLGVIVATLLIGTTQLSDIQRASWLPLLGPMVVIFIGLPVALNQFGWERNASSFLFALPAGPRQLLIGKNLATGTALFVETMALSVILAWVSGGWETLPMVPPLALTAIGCQLAVGNIVSVLAPLRLPDMGTDLFAQATEQGCLAITAQMVSFFVIGLLMTLPASAYVLVVEFGRVLDPVVVSLASLAWGAIIYSIGLWFAARVLRKRIPETVALVQTV
jgi:ABC-2 type transport system permease protein